MYSVRMPWFFALRAIFESLPPLDFLTYQIHIPSPRNGFWDLPPCPPWEVLPVPPPAAEPLAGRRNAAATRAARMSAAGAMRARRWSRRERVGTQGRLPVGLSLVLGACMSTPTAARVAMLP